MVVAPAGTTATWLNAGLTTSPSGCKRVISMGSTVAVSPDRSDPVCAAPAASDEELGSGEQLVRMPSNTASAHDQHRRNGSRARQFCQERPGCLCLGME